ncbi:chemotaxis response regulator protein-glutamate methylesterase [Clostridiaceae bacterium UIB06]|uniref:Protein-glutamate methylesterase/protein-glutamine glutaminase n=1 Tax=Clostridium thailandense TaxID=2794346 RepID=A0A949WU69_9CLOT|nr:chemotaxis response regulator protein-glutamate methylesterase [Clostridium thailandense]MBV7272272.1 chemotaxis response regulator protein-glutamate methylesterase [Clostridium thailandense]MCH5137818.1 chemotaxis response regulator protein-glutamate methylesterase [Clostridiaceae bacterium UIB06]
MGKIKVLVVEDSALMRKIISDMINEQADMEVIDIARNGEDLLEKLPKNVPDVITLDVEMPKMDGITALKELKKLNINIPVIVLSSITNKGPQLTMDCLAAGAFDFLPKPSGAISLDINKVKNDLIQKIKLAYEKKISINQYKAITKNVQTERKVVGNKNIKKLGTGKIEAVVIGASTGGPKALYAVITALPERLGVPVFVVQHMPVGFTKAFAERLNLNSKIKVVEAADEMNIENNTVYIAPGGFHMEVGSDNKIHLNSDPTLWGVRPAVDKLFVSASNTYGSKIISAVLTGMGRDGAQGTIEIKKNGGITISEDKSTCTIYGMPKAAYETGMVDMVLPIDNIAKEIIKVVSAI